MPIVKLSSKGQIVIPAEIREHLNLDKGDKVLIEKKNDDVVLKPVVRLSRLRGIDRGKWRATSKEVDKMRKEWDREFGAAKAVKQ